MWKIDVKNRTNELIGCFIKFDFFQIQIEFIRGNLLNFIIKESSILIKAQINKKSDKKSLDIVLKSKQKTIAITPDETQLRL